MGITSQINVRENEGAPETLGTFGTEDTGRRLTKRKNTTHHRKLRKSNTDRTQNRGRIDVLVKGKQFPHLFFSFFSFLGSN